MPITDARGDGEDRGDGGGERIRYAQREIAETALATRPARDYTRTLRETKRNESEGRTRLE